MTTPPAEQGDSLLGLHILCMVLAFGFLLPVGAAFAIMRRRLREAPAATYNESLWFRRHKHIQRAGVGLCFVGFCFAVQYKVVTGAQNQFTSFHHILGLLLFVSSALQALFGELRPPAPTDDVTDPTTPAAFRKAWRKYHRINGGVILACGYVNMVAGAAMYNSASNVPGSVRAIAPQSLLVYTIVAFSLLGLMFAIFNATRPPSPLASATSTRNLAVERAMREADREAGEDEEGDETAGINGKGEVSSPSSSPAMVESTTAANGARRKITNKKGKRTSVVHVAEEDEIVDEEEEDENCEGRRGGGVVII